MNDDAFSERLVEAAARSVQATCPRLVPSSTRDLQAADQRWFGLCAQLICLTRRANSALGSAHAGGHIDVQADPGARQLTLRYGDGWLIVKRERLGHRGHIAVERSYRLPAFTPEPTGPAALEDLLVELVAAGGAAALVAAS